MDKIYLISSWVMFKKVKLVKYCLYIKRVKILWEKKKGVQPCLVTPPHLTLQEEEGEDVEKWRVPPR